MSKKEFEELIKLIIARTGMTQEQLSLDSGRNKGYISQVLSRGKASGKYVELLRAKYGIKEGEVSGSTEFNIGVAVKKIQAGMDVTLLAVAELLAKANNQPIAVVVDQLEGLVKKRINDAELDK